MATKAYPVFLTFFLLLSGYLVHSATAARVIWLTPSPPMTGRTAWLTPSPPLPQPEHSGIDAATLGRDKDSWGTPGEPRGEPYTRGTTRGNPRTTAPAPGIPATRIPSGPVVGYPPLNPNHRRRCRHPPCHGGGGPPAKP